MKYNFVFVLDYSTSQLEKIHSYRENTLIELMWILKYKTQETKTVSIANI